MPTPRKSVAVLTIEGKSHRTKEEITKRKRAEAAALTGKVIGENEQVKNNKLAHTEFLRMKSLLKKIKKDDDIYRNVINRYCLLCAECIEFVEKRETIFQQLNEFCEKKYEMIENGDMTIKEAFKMEADMQGHMIAMDKQIQTKRKMMLDIEKENGWTVKASLQTIPPTIENKVSPLKEILVGG